MGDSLGGAMASSRTLLIIDVQRDYFPGGAYPLVEPEAAAESARRVLEGFREAGEPVIHMKHVWDAPDAEFMKPGTEGIEIHPAVEPAEGEVVLEKSHPNSFLDTPLEEELRKSGGDLVVAGMMSSMCVDATVRAAADLGFSPTVVHDACAAPDLDFNGVEVPGAAVHAAFMAALADGYAEVTSAAELLAAG
jgi:nicotinamidase-related amidase